MEDTCTLKLAHHKVPLHLDANSGFETRLDQAACRGNVGWVDRFSVGN